MENLEITYVQKKEKNTKQPSFQYPKRTNVIIQCTSLKMDF